MEVNRGAYSKTPLGAYEMQSKTYKEACRAKPICTSPRRKGQDKVQLTFVFQLLSTTVL